MNDETTPDWVKSLRNLSEQENERASVVADMLLKESDRGCAIFGAAILHEDLERLLRAFFRDDEDSIKHVVNPLFQTYAPLATFSSRIQLAFAMRLITRDLRYRLGLVRRLRNEFAHESGPISFEDQKCQGRLRILISDGKPFDRRPNSEVKLLGGQMLTEQQFVNRIAFIISISELSARIHFLEDVIRIGKDVRSAVAALELKGR